MYSYLQKEVQNSRTLQVFCVIYTADSVIILYCLSCLSHKSELLGGGGN